mmetsp:Transcript_26575/g.25662  ORF Transcript_26575/g.25662 Transcript_26575/m.25662 type:complete len:105 (-) Transcript_26575:17-331(-)
MDQLFKLFGKIHDQSNINKSGVGLGLTICKKLCELQSGTISVQSTEDHGSTFTFTLKAKIKVQREDSGILFSKFETDDLFISERQENDELSVNLKLEYFLRRSV